MTDQQSKPPQITPLIVIQQNPGKIYDPESGGVVGYLYHVGLKDGSEHTFYDVAPMGDVVQRFVAALTKNQLLQFSGVVTETVAEGQPAPEPNGSGFVVADQVNVLRYRNELDLDDADDDEGGDDEEAALPPAGQRRGWTG